MTMFDKLLFAKTAKKSKEKAGQASPRHIDVYRRPSSDALSGISRMSESEQHSQAPVHRWQSWDYSDPVYEVDRHPVCKGHSRKLSDLGAVQPVERVASAPPPKGTAAALHHKETALKAVLAPCLSAPAGQDEGSDTAAATEQACLEVQH